MRVGPGVAQVAREWGEPPHIHVQRERFLAKYWLQPISLVSSKRFRSHELRAIQRIVDEHHVQFMDAWNEHATR
ncbi:MAG: DUF4160 domain-containing protein [Dehalococcoidia bacterium]